MKPLGLPLLCTLLLPGLAWTAPVSTPPVLPMTTAMHDLAVPAGTTREFDVELPRTEKLLEWGIKRAGTQGTLSGSLLLSQVDGVPLREVSLDGRELSEGIVLLPTGVRERRIRISLRGGAKDMSVDMAVSSLTQRSPRLQPGQEVAVFPRHRGSEAFKEVFELRLSRVSDVDLRTWGGDSNVRLQVTGPWESGGIPPSRCDDAGHDAWRACVLPALEPGIYRVTVDGTGAAVNLIGRWNADGA